MAFFRVARDERKNTVIQCLCFRSIRRRLTNICFMVPFLSAAVTWLDSFPTHLVRHAQSVPVDRDGVTRIFAVSIRDVARKSNLVYSTFPALGTRLRNKENNTLILCDWSPPRVVEGLFERTFTNYAPVKRSLQ